MKEGKTPEQKQYKLIETREQFSERINDIKSQIAGLRILLEMGFGLEKMKESKTTLTTFAESMENSGEKLPPALEKDKNCQELISFYDGLIKRLKNFETMAELQEILKEESKFPQPLINTERQFWDVLSDAKNQFYALRLFSEMISEDELIKKNKDTTYLNFLDHVASRKMILSDEFLQNKFVQDLIKTYDELIKRIRVVKSKKDFNSIMEGADELLDEFKLGIDNK